MGGSSKQEVQSNLRNEPALVTSATSGVLLWRSQLVQLVFANHRKSLDIRVISTAFVSFSDPYLLFLILRHVLVYVLSSEKAVTKQVLVLGVGCCVAVGLLSFSPHHHHSPPQSGWVGEAMVNIDH